MENYQTIAKELNSLVKDYDLLTRTIQQVKNRWASTHPDVDYKFSDLLNGVENKKGELKSQGLEQIKGRQSRKLEKYLKNFRIYSDWMEDIPGIGPAIAGSLIRSYYFKFMPVCKKCGELIEKKDKTFWCPRCNKSIKGDGMIEHRVEFRDFPTISSWWHFMGRHNDGEGRMPKRKVGVKSDWGTDKRRLGFLIRESFNRGKTKYREYADKRKRYRELTHPKASKAHRHNMAWNETVKLFLSHFWQVAHEIDGLPMTDPWSVAHGGHDAEHIIPPYYWNGNEPKGS